MCVWWQTLFFTTFEVINYTFANATEPVPGHLLHETTLRVRSKKTGEVKTVGAMAWCGVVAC